MVQLLFPKEKREKRRKKINKKKKKKEKKKKLRKKIKIEFILPNKGHLPDPIRVA
jgi:hypothetical protein